MENTTLLIDEKEKENAKALTQSFARKDVKSRAYVNVLGAEACMRYLKDEGISVGEIYNMHNIRKILEEFDISDLMLSNISIDVRVVFNENEIFIPKSHFEFNITPDIYVVLKINKDYSETEFLGFFEPKMINKNNSNDDYYFIEKEKLSSPETFKTYVENHNGSTNSDISDSDMENAEILMIAMADHNISEADMKTLLNYLKTNAALRDKFSEFESFEMIAYQAANTEEMINLINNGSLTASDTAVAEPEAEENAEALAGDMMAVSETEGISEALAEDLPAASETEDIDAQLDEFMEGSEGELGSLESALDEFSSVDNLAEENKEADFEDFSEMVKEDEKSDGNAIGDMLAGGAVLGAEIAGAAVASAAISGAVEGAEIVKDAAQAADAAIDAAGNIADSVTDKAPEIESKASDGLIDNIDVSAEIANMEDASLNTDLADIENLKSVETEQDTLVQENTEDEVQATDMFSEIQNLVAEDNVLSDETAIAFEQSEAVNTESDVSSNEILEASLDELDFGDGSDDIEFSNNDDNFGDLVFEDNDDDTPSFSSHSEHSFGSGSPGISTVVNTPISQATDLVSLESIQESMLAKKMEHIEPGSLMETMEMDEFQNLVDNYVHKEIKDMSETTEFSDIEKEAAKNTVDPKLPSNVDASIYKDVDESNTDDFVEDMPEPEDNAIKTTAAEDDVNSDDFVEDMPEEVASTEEYPSEPTSDDFVEDMPKDIQNVEIAEEKSEAVTENISDVKEEISSPQEDIATLEAASARIDEIAESAETDMFSQDGISSLDDLSNIDLKENPDIAVDSMTTPQTLGDIPDFNSDMFDQTDIDAAAMGNVKSYESDEPAAAANVTGEKLTAENTPEFDLDDIEAAAMGNVKSYKSDEPAATADVPGEKLTAENTPEFDLDDIEAAAMGNVKSYESDEPAAAANVTGEKLTAENTPEFDLDDIEAAAMGNVKSFSEDSTSDTVVEDAVQEKPADEITPEVNITEDALDVNTSESNLEFSDGEGEILSEQSFLDELESELGEETIEEPAEAVEAVITESADVSEAAAPDIAEATVDIAEETAGIAAEESVADIKEVPEEEVKANNFSELSGLDSIEDFSGGMDEVPEVVEEENLSSTASTGDNGSLGVLYSAGNSPEQMVSPIPEDLAEDANYDFKPKKNYALIPIAAALIVTLIAGSVVGVMMKSKSSVDSETLIQTSPDNGTLANPETDNSGVLSNENSDDIEPAIPDENDDLQADAGVVAPVDNDGKISQAAKQEAIKNTKEAVKKTNEAIKEQAAQANAPKKPLNANKSITLRKVSWEVPDYLSYSDNIKTYLQTAGKSIKLTLSSDLLLTNDYIYSNTVKINLKLDKSGSIQSSQITQSSGSTQVDKIVLQTVKDTLNVVKPAAGEVPTPTYNLGLIIYL